MSQCVTSVINFNSELKLESKRCLEVEEVKKSMNRGSMMYKVPYKATILPAN